MCGPILPNLLLLHQNLLSPHSTLTFEFPLHLVVDFSTVLLTSAHLRVTASGLA